MPYEQFRFIKYFDNESLSKHALPLSCGHTRQLRHPNTVGLPARPRHARTAVRRARPVPREPCSKCTCDHRRFGGERMHTSPIDDHGRADAHVRGSGRRWTPHSQSCDQPAIPRPSLARSPRLSLSGTPPRSSVARTTSSSSSLSLTQRASRRPASSQTSTTTCPLSPEPPTLDLVRCSSLVVVGVRRILRSRLCGCVAVGPSTQVVHQSISWTSGTQGHV